MEIIHQPLLASQPPQHSRNLWSLAGISFLLLVLLAACAGLMARIAAQSAVRDRPSAAAQPHENAARLETDFRIGTAGGSDAKSLRDILAHPELVPTHNHPLLGRQAPDFELADLGGKSWKLRELLTSGPVVLIFYHTYCDLCDRQLFTDKKDLSLFRELGATVVAISADQPDVTRRRFEQFGPFGFPVLSDPGNKVAQAYHAFHRADDGATTGRLLHGTFIIDRHGTVRWVNVGDAPFRSNPALLSILAKIEGRLPQAQAQP